MVGLGRFGSSFGLVAFSVVIGGAASSVLADSFYLKNGTVIEGSIVKGTNNTLTLASSGTVQLTSIGLIERVVLKLADGSEVAGELLGWKDGVLELRSADDVVRIADGKVLEEEDVVSDVAVAEAPAEDPVDQAIAMQGFPSFLLDNGKKLVGEILHATGSVFTLRLQGGSATPVSRAQIQSVEILSEDGTLISGELLEWRDGVYWLQLNDREVLAGHPDALARISAKIAAAAEPTLDQLETPVAAEIEQADAALLPPAEVKETDLEAEPASPSEVGIGGPANETAVAALEAGETVEDAASSPVDITEDQHVIETSVDAVDEDGESVVFRFQLDKPAIRPLVVLYAATEASAKAGEDFEAKSGVITFSTGSTYAEVQVPIIDDDQGEDSEEFNLFLSGDPKTIAFSQRQIAVTINDND